MSIRKITLGLALAAVSTFGLAGATATSSEAHHRHHFFRAGLFYGPAYYAYNYAPCDWVWTRRGRVWYCY